MTATVSLRPYQTEAIDAVMRELVTRRSTVIEAATGTGKSRTGSQMVRTFVDEGKRVLWLAHRGELIDQAERAHRAVGLEPGVEKAGRRAKDERVVIASVQTMRGKRLAKFAADAFDVIVIDECFPAGTMVDGKSIETLKVGDLVRSYNHKTNKVEYRPVKNLFRSSPALLATVYLSDGREVVCTPGHPFWNGYEYVMAADLQPEDRVYGHSTKGLRSLRNDLPTEVLELDNGSGLLGELQGGSPRSAQEARRDDLHLVRETGDGERPQGAGAGSSGSSVLLRGLQGEVGESRPLGAHGAHQLSPREFENDAEQPDALQKFAGQDEQHAARNRTSTSGARREWYRPDEGGSYVARSVTRRMEAAGGADRYEGWNPNKLQDRPRQLGVDGCSRDRREESRDDGQTGPGSQEGELVAVARVVRVEIHQRAGDDGFGQLCPGDLVYNIEVEDNHNYFVDDVLVHNCHHAPAEGYQNIVRHFPKAKVIGLTATPDRADGVSMRTVFETCAFRYGIAQAVEEGYLVPARGIQVVVEGMDLSKVRQKVIKNGVAKKTPEEGWGELPPAALGEVRDLNQTDLGKAALAPEAVEGIVEPLLELAEARRTVVFAVNVEHAIAIASSIHARKPGAARYIHGKMPEHERKAILQAFEAGEYQYLINCMLLVEGWDCPATACVAMARPTQSRVLYAQAVGRGLRLYAGKLEALVIDFVGVSCKFDLIGPDDVLAGAMVAPTRALKKASTPVPQQMKPYEPAPVKVSFVTKVVELMFKTGYRIGRAVGEGVQATYEVAKTAGTAARGWFSRLFGGGK